MPRILWLCALVWLLLFERNTLQAQETWQIQHIIDNDDYVMGVQQSHLFANAPRDNRGLALSPDHRFLYLGYNNPADRRVVRKISLQVQNPADNRLAVVAQLVLPTASAPAKAIATDDKGRVYLARGRVLEVYDEDLRNRLYSLSGFSQCEGLAVARFAGRLVLYATDRERKMLTRFELTEGAGVALNEARKSGLGKEGELFIARARSLRGVAIQNDGTVWLADHEAGLVFRVRENGRLNESAVRNAVDIALDERREEVFVTQDTNRTITVLRLADGAFMRTMTPPFAELRLEERRTGLALTGVEVIPGERVFVCNESGRSIKTGPFSDSPFESEDDTDIVFDDDNDPVLVMQFSFAAEAGRDREIMPGEAALLGGNPTARGGQPPYRYRWAPLEGLNDNTLSNPVAKPSRTTTYNLLITDKSRKVAQAQVRITVPTFVLLARDFVFFGGNENSVGNIFSNGPITFERGLPGVHRGNLLARGDITIFGQNRIVGNLKTRGKIILREDAKVEGNLEEAFEIPEIPLPQFSFQAGGADMNVAADSALAPGSYGRVRVAPRATLHLQNGDYFFEKLLLQNASRLVFENAAAATVVHVTTGFSMGENAAVSLAQVEGANTTQVYFKILQKGSLEIGKNAILLGNLHAPAAHVYFASGARLLGGVIAEAITVAKNVAFHEHPAGPEELAELLPIYIRQEFDSAPSRARSANRKPAPLDTALAEATPADSTRATIPQEVSPKVPALKPRKKPEGNKLIPILAGIVLLALLLLLLFLLFRRKRATAPPDYWKVQQTRRNAAAAQPRQKSKKNTKSHWRIRSRR